jgi:hypothetical protein
VANSGDTSMKGLFRSHAKSLSLRIHFADRDGAGVVTDITIATNHDIERNQVAFLDDSLWRTDAVDDFIVNRNTNVTWVSETSDNITITGTFAAMT